MTALHLCVALFVIITLFISFPMMKETIGCEKKLKRGERVNAVAVNTI